MPAAVTVNFKLVDGTVGSGGGGGGGGSWGSITGTLSDQTDLQAALDLKAPLTSPTFLTSARFSYSTASRVPYLDANKDLVASSVTATELGYLSGVTSAIQTQLNAKGVGDFVGPASSTDNAILRFDGTTGKLGQNSAVTIADTSGAMTFTASSGANIYWTTDGAGNIGDLTANRPDGIAAKTIVRVGSSGTCYLYNPSGNGILRLANAHELTHSSGSIFYQVSSTQVLQFLGSDGSVLTLGAGSQFRTPYGTASKPSFASTSDYQSGFYVSASNTVGISTNQTARLTIGSDGIVNCSNSGIRTKVSTANTANPPTDAELDSAFGTPATVGSGFHAILNDAGGGTNEYFVWSDGTNWFYVTGTLAV